MQTLAYGTRYMYMYLTILFNLSLLQIFLTRNAAKSTATICRIVKRTKARNVTDFRWNAPWVSYKITSTLLSKKNAISQGGWGIEKQ